MEIENELDYYEYNGEKTFRYKTENNIEYYGLRDANSLQERGLIDLMDYMNQHIDVNNSTMIEIGSYAGDSTKVFANRVKSVIAIDPFVNYAENNPIAICELANFSDVYEVFLENTKSFDNIRHIRKSSNDAILELKNTLVDFVYIDGHHTYEQAKQDVINYLQIIKPGGFIAGHDCLSEEVMRAVHECLGDVDQLFVDTSWVKQII